MSPRFDEDELADRLFRAVSGLPSAAPDPEPLRRAGKRRRDRRRAASATGVLLTVVALAVGVAVAVRPTAGPAPRPQFTRPPTPSASAAPSAPASAAASSSAVAPAPPASTSTVDPTAPLRLAYANATGVWIRTFDPVTHTQVGAPVRVSDALTASVPGRPVADSLEFSPQGRYLVWREVGTPSGYPSSYDLYDGETGEHVAITPTIEGQDGGGIVTATGTGLAELWDQTIYQWDRAGRPSTVSVGSYQGAVPGFTGLGTGAAPLGSYPGGFFGTVGTELVKVSADDGTVTAVRDVGDQLLTAAAGDAAGNVVISTETRSPSNGCERSIATVTTLDPDGAVTGTAVFSLHPGWVAGRVTISSDGTAGASLTDCAVKGSTPKQEFVELDGSLAHKVADQVQAASRGPGGLLAEIATTTATNGHTDIGAGSVSGAADGPTPLGEVTELAWAPEHRP